MNAFITGATGFIGSHLADRLIDHPGWADVRCLVRNNEKWLKGKAYTRVDGDLDSIKSMERAMKGADVVFHLAAIVKARSQNELDHVNVDATENIIHLAKRSGVKKLVILSSLAASGPSSGKPRTESDPMNPVSMYGKSKKKMEEMVHREADKNLSITIIRPPAVYGPREDQIYTLFKIMSKGISPIVGDGEDPKISLLYIDDLIQAILLAANQNEKGIHPYFVSGDRITNWNEISDIVKTVLNKKMATIHLQSHWVKNIAGLIETTASFFGTYPVINREKANEMVLEWTCSHKKAVKELQYKPEFTLEEGLSRTIRWYKKHNWL